MQFVALCTSTGNLWRRFSEHSLSIWWKLNHTFMASGFIQNMLFYPTIVMTWSKAALRLFWDLSPSILWMPKMEGRVWAGELSVAFGPHRVAIIRPWTPVNCNILQPTSDDKNDDLFSMAFRRHFKEHGIFNGQLPMAKEVVPVNQLVAINANSITWKQVLGLFTGKYNDISDSSLDGAVKTFQGEHPGLGIRMLTGNLKGQGITLQRQRIKQSPLRTKSN